MTLLALRGDRVRCKRDPKFLKRRQRLDLAAAAASSSLSSWRRTLQAEERGEAAGYYLLTQCGTGRGMQAVQAVLTRGCVHPPGLSCAASHVCASWTAGS